MGRKFKAVKYKIFIKFLKAHGCERTRQTGSHEVFKRPDMTNHLSVPKHPDISKGVAEQLLKKLGVTKNQFLDWLENPKKK
jgi:predicted RNA binding protein YcfA (HicA-like mRNA interferase family)